MIGPLEVLRRAVIRWDSEAAMPFSSVSSGKVTTMSVVVLANTTAPLLPSNKPSLAFTIAFCRDSLSIPGLWDTVGNRVCG